MIIGGVCCGLLVGAAYYASLAQTGVAGCDGGADLMVHEAKGASDVRFLHGPTPPVLTDVLGVLRRPPADQDKLGASALRSLGLSEVWKDGVRLIATIPTWDLRFFMVPGVMLDYRSACERGSREARANLGAPLVSLDIYDPSGRVGPAAYTVGDIRAGRIVRMYGARGAGGRRGEQEIVAGIVPNGVASVKVNAEDMPARTVKVRENFFEVEIPTGKQIAKTVSGLTWFMTWYDEAGRTLKVVTRTARRMSFRVKMEVPE